MLYGIISDVHGNLAALRNVLEHMPEVDVLVCLGDIVGYGPDPDECVDIIRQNASLSVLGNHDVACATGAGLEAFNADAACACEWTARHLSPASRNYLAGLPTTETRTDITMVHGSPCEPIWEYVHSESVAARNFPFFQTRYCLVGHTHLPAVFCLRDGRVESLSPPFLQPQQFTQGRYIINPGSVGQPRDHNPHASFAVLDTESGRLQHFRVAYPIAETQAKMRAAGLPSRLIARLAYGW